MTLIDPLSAPVDDPVLVQAAKINPAVRKIAQDPFAALPEYTFEFYSKVYPDLDGTVVLRYPTLGDVLEIERISTPGKAYSNLGATLAVLVKKAPASWYKRVPGEDEPRVSLARLPFDQGFADLYHGYITWRDTFRPGGESGNPPGAE